MAVILRSPLIFAVILLISLALNLFLGGVGIGWYLQKADNFHPLMSADLNHPPALLNVFPEAKERIQPILQRNGTIVHPKILQLQRAKRDVYRQIAAEPLDVAALTKAFAHLRQVESEAKTAIHQVFIEVVSSLTKEERQRLEQGLPRHRGPPRHSDSGDPYRGEPPFPPPFSRKMDKLIEKRDRNGDNKLSREEFLAAVPEERQKRANRHFQMLDVDQDGFVTQSEIETMPPELPPPPPPPGEFEEF